MRSTYIWGAGHYGVLTALDCERKRIEVAGFIDSNASKIKTRLGLPVLEPNFIISTQSFVIIAVWDEKAIKEITEYLEKIGLKENEDFHYSDYIKRNDRKSLECLEYYSKSKTDMKMLKLIAENIFATNFNGQCYQDVIAALWHKGKQDGFFVDIGANDGKHISNSLYFEQVGWKGICVEPLPDVFLELQANRKCECINSAISDKSGKMEFLKVTGPEKWYDMLSGFSISHSHMEAILKVGGTINPIKVQVMTFEDIMSMHPQIKHIDFLSIDTEGHEMNVLKSIDFAKYTFGFICIECNEEKKELITFMVQQGYEIFMGYGCDVFFVPKGIK